MGLSDLYRGLVRITTPCPLLGQACTFEWLYEYLSITHCIPAISSFLTVCTFCLQVSWVRRKAEDVHLITFGLHTYSSDNRYSLNYQQPNDWKLQIQFANERDEGQYECRVSSHPPLVHTVYLYVVGKFFKNILLCIYHCIFSLNCLMDLSTDMSYWRNQMQHKKLRYDSENRFSVQGLNSPLIVFKDSEGADALRAGPGDVTDFCNFKFNLQQIEALHRGIFLSLLYSLSYIGRYMILN